MQRSELKIVVCGGGLAGRMTALALEGALGTQYEIVLIDDGHANDADIVYGSVTSPTAYDFLRGLGLDEPVLFSNSNTSFSFGTQYYDWPGVSADWVQCHHQILPFLDGVPLQHHLTRNQRQVSPLLISGLAARQGKFAHPPEENTNPLSRAEYGYQFAADEWARLLETKLSRTRVTRVASQIANVSTDQGEIRGVALSSGDAITGDIYVDCTGLKRQLMSAIGASFNTSRKIALKQAVQPADPLGPPCRKVRANANGWSAQVFLQNEVQTLTVERGDDATNSMLCELGHQDAGWVGNAVAIGAAASVHDPLTPGPMVMLQRDIERLLDLVPISSDVSMERREFNRRRIDDSMHTDMFADAFYVSNVAPAPFWRDANAAAQSEGLKRKIVQFESRGVLAKYDLEPFNDEDWMILHHGMGRHAARYDLQADASPKLKIDQQLDGMSRAIEQLVARMPPHHLYVANMKRYFEKQQYA